MPGKHITTQQVRLYMTQRNQGNTQAGASAKAGVSERTGRRMEIGDVTPSAPAQRCWRTRKDPFAAVWDSEIVPLLERQPALDPTTLFEDLQDRHPGVYANGADAPSNGGSRPGRPCMDRTRKSCSANTMNPVARDYRTSPN